MKNIYLLTTLLGTAAFADSGEEVAAIKKQPAQSKVEATPFIEYNNRMAVFGPLHQVYERTKPDAFYVGVEGWCLPVWNSEKSGEHMFGEAEIRMGYNYFYNGRDHVTPFAGVGMLRDYTEVRHEEGVFFNGQFYKRHHHSEKMEAIGYGVIGFLFDHEFNRCVCLGSNFKFLVGGSFSEKHQSWGNPVVGIDIGIPLTFRCGYKRHWDFRIEPFDIYLNGRNVSCNYIGFRSTVGYRF